MSLLLVLLLMWYGLFVDLWLFDLGFWWFSCVVCCLWGIFACLIVGFVICTLWFGLRYCCVVFVFGCLFFVRLLSFICWFCLLCLWLLYLFVLGCFVVWVRICLAVGGFVFWMVFCGFWLCLSLVGLCQDLFCYVCCCLGCDCLIFLLYFDDLL